MNDKDEADVSIMYQELYLEEFNVGFQVYSHVFVLNDRRLEVSFINDISDVKLSDDQLS